MIGDHQFAAWAQARRRTLIVLAAAAVALLGLIALYHLLRTVRPHEIGAAFDALSPLQLAGALLLTAISYLMLTFYDRFALVVIGRKLAWRTYGLASFTSYALSHNLGLALLTGGSARYRIYRAAGLGIGEVGSVIALAGLSFWNGIFLLGGLAAVASVHSITLLDHMVPSHWLHLGGAILLAVCLLPPFLSPLGVKAVNVGGWRTPVPGPGNSAAMTVVAILDMTAASAALFVLLPAPNPALYPAFVFGYALAIIVAFISHIPGGLGVFEAVVIATIPGDKAQLLAALLAYRAIYYLLPLLVAALLLAWHERQSWRGPATVMAGAGRTLLRETAPPLLAALVFAGGVILLLSGATPSEGDRMHMLRHVVPLPFVEASHLGASLAGTLLLFIAPGLLRRLDGAFVLTRALLAAAVVFSLAKGGDYEEAFTLLGILAALQLSRAAFYRKTALMETPLATGWILAAFSALAASMFVGFFAYRHVAYVGSLWWQFSLNGDAPRFLRASLAIAVLVSGLAVRRILVPAGRIANGDAVDLDRLSRALDHASSADAFLAFSGDKRLLFAAEGDAFLMYRVDGYHWIVLGDPVGPEERWAELLWRLRDQSDRAQGDLLLYQISSVCLPYAIDLGLAIMKYGEEARVELKDFTIEGARGKSLRHALRRAEQEGAEFSVIPAEDVAGILPKLRTVSDEWLASKRQREKSFSLGAFDPDYLARFPCAVVRVEGVIVAFANIFATPNRIEMSVDLMRHSARAPYGTMDYLFVQLIRYARAEGFEWFSMGIAPLAGIDGRKLAPAWARGAALLFRHGTPLYGFAGLKAYKAKFATKWEPRFIAGPRGLQFARAIGAVRRVISRRA